LCEKIRIELLKPQPFTDAVILFPQIDHVSKG